MKVLGIGESVIDNYIIEGQKAATEAPPGGLHVGGVVPAALILLARMGVDCEFMTSLGQDVEGETIASVLENENITVHTNPQPRSKIGTIIVGADGRRKKIHASAKHTPLTGLDRAHLASFDLIIIDRHERAAFYEVMRKKRRATKVVIDPSTEVSDFTRDMIRQAECPIIPIESLCALQDTENIFSAVTALQRQCAQPLTVTLGDLGSLAYDGKHLAFAPALQLPAVVDTCGAGDIFRGAFAYGLLQKWNRQRCARFANIAAGLQCTRLGNVAAIPTKAEITAHARAARRRLDLHHVNEYFQQLRKEYATQ